MRMDYPIQSRQEIEAQGIADASQGLPNPYEPGSAHAMAWQKGADQVKQERKQ